MTRARLNRIVTLASAGMILCWFDVLNSLVMPALARRPLPVTLAALIVAGAIFNAFLISSWSLKRIGIAALHVLGFLASLALVLHISGDPAYAFYDFRWVTQAPSFAAAVWYWLKFLVNLWWTVLLYYLGYQLHSRKADFRNTSNRLDIGITVFSLVLIVKLVAEDKGVVIPYEHSLGRQLVCFMMLGLFSSGVARNQTSHRNSTISYYKGAGMVLSFGLLAAVFGTAMAMLFLTELIEGAIWGKGVLDQTWPYIEHAATQLANSKLLLGYVDWVVANVVRAGLTKIPSWEMTYDGPDPFYLKVVFAIGTFYALVVLWFIVEWMLHKPDGSQKRPGPWVILRLMARRVKRIVMRILQRLYSKRDPRHRVEQYYRLLQKWGARSGLPRASCETPNEYGARLADYFPNVTREISYLIERFNLARYSGRAAQPSQLIQIQEGWKRLRSPTLWPLRARLWLFRARI